MSPRLLRPAQAGQAVGQRVVGDDRAGLQGHRFGVVPHGRGQISRIPGVGPQDLVLIEEEGIRPIERKVRDRKAGGDHADSGQQDAIHLLGSHAFQQVQEADSGEDDQRGHDRNPVARRHEEGEEGE